MDMDKLFSFTDLENSLKTGWVSLEDRLQVTFPQVLREACTVALRVDCKFEESWSAVSASGVSQLVKVAHLGHKGLRAVVKQVLQVQKKSENRIKANKCKSQSTGSKACPGYP